MALGGRRSVHGTGEHTVAGAASVTHCLKHMQYLLAGPWGTELPRLQGQEGTGSEEHIKKENKEKYMMAQALGSLFLNQGLLPK